VHLHLLYFTLAKEKLIHHGSNNVCRHASGHGWTLLMFMKPAEAKEQIQGAAELDVEALAKEQIDRAVDIVAEMQLTSDQLKVFRL
jgi:hypothetical protein